ncbi:DNA mismatch repair protein Mlh3-like [Branchiostoma floridae x Branchiostoma belcheri]
MIRPLDPSVRAQLRSGVSVPSVAQCVEELVLNSLDAAATCIAVRIDLENFWIQVVDNGHGIPKDQLTIVGDRYATSKCHTVTDLENLNFFGFRGEALASIAQVCAVLEIESRHKVSTKVNTKVFRHGKVVSVFESKNHRPTNGTTVTVHNVFHNLPVRQKFVSASLEWERIRERVAAIALIHPGVSFTLRNENVGGKYLQTHKTSSLVACFGSLFGNKKSMSLREASHQHKQFKISGFISREGHRNKDLQFLYINSRLILRTKVHKFLNLLLSKSTVVNRRAGQWEPRTPTVRDSSAADASSPGKQRDYYGMFVLNISCPLSEYDISLDPSKTLVEFKEWETLLTCVQDMVQKFLKQENLTMSLDPNVGEHMSSLLQDEKITISKSSPGRAGTAGVDLQTVTNNSGVDYGEGISTLNSNAILHSKTVNRLSHTKLANSGDTEGQGHADNARSEPEDGTCKASAEESHHLCTSVYMDDICQEDKYQMPREDKAVPVHIDLESHASHTSAKAESKGAELTSEEQSGMDDTMDDTFDYGPAVSQGYSNEQLFTTNSLNDSFLKENDIQSLVVSSDVESSTVTSAPVPDLSSHQCQTLADSNESKLGHADDRLEEENVHCNSNEVSNSPPKQLFTSIKVTRSPPDFKETRTVSSELNDSGVELYDDGRATEKSCLTKFSKASKSSKITLSGKKQPSLSSKLSKMANISTDDGEKHVVRPSSIDVRNNTLPEDLPQVDARPQQKHHVRLEDKAKDSTNEYTRIGKNDESCGLIALDRVKSTSSLGLFKTSQAELVRTELYPRDSGKSFRSSTSKGKCKDARRSPVSMMKDESLCHSSSSAVTSTPRRACLGTASPSMCLNKSSCKFTPAISLKRSYSELSLQKLSKRVRLYSGDATLQKPFSARHQSKEQNLSSDIQRDVTKKEGKTEQKPKQSIFKTPHGKNVTIDNVNDPRVHKQITTESAVNNESSEKRTRNLTNNYIHISGDKCSVPYRVDNQAKMKRKFVTSENLLQTPSKILLQKAHQSDAAKAQEGSKAGSALLLFAGQTEQRKVQCPTSRTESAHISPMEWQGINEVTYESHGWRHEVPNQVEDTDSSMLYYPDISVDVKEKLKTATKDLAYETSDLIHAASEQGMENSLARTVSSHDKDLALQSRSPSSDETDKFVFSPKSTFKNVSMAAIIPSKTFQEDAEDTRELLCASSNFHEIDSQPINPARFLGEMRELCRFSSTSEETVRNECHTRSNFQKYEHESTVHQGSTESLHSVCNQQEVNRDCGEMELDSTGLCAAEKVRNCELIGKLKDTHGNNSANWEQGLEQIVPGSHESIDLTCQPAEHGSEDVPNEYTGNSLHNRELCEDSQCAQISRTPKPVIPTRAVTSRQLSTSSPNVITATSPAGCHSKADMVRHDSMEDCRSDGLENMADMKAKTGAVEKDCTVQEKERSCEMSVGSGQKVVESHEAQEELCKIKVTDRELTNTTKQCSLEHHRSALSDGFRKVNAVWARQFDQTCGVEVYVNLMTGHTQLDCPEDDRVDVGTSSSVNVSMSAGGEKKWKGTVHPFLTHNATPFLPRAKRPCQDTDKLSTSSTQHALGQMLAAHQEEQEERSGVKWRDRVPNEADKSNNEESVAQLWDSWENPVFSRTEKSILNVAAGTGGTARVRTVIQPYRFSREMLDSIQIIGQVDNKFIACMMKNSSHNFTTTSAPNLLVLIDQHAAHERVRLEKLHEDLYEVDPGSPHQHLKSSHVIPPLEVPLPAEELRLLQAYKPAFQRLGLNFSTVYKMNTAVVSSLPCCVVEREYNERKRGRLAVAVELVESLIKEQLELLKTTDGAGATLPHTLHRILNSQACHGAIKFGDPLEEADCADLIRCLSRCNLPFQCAHGRPSLIPIIDLTSPIQKEEESQEYSRPNLGKLKHCIACEGSQSSHHKALQEDHSLLQES